MIETKQFGLTRSEFFLITIQLHFRKLWWLFVGVLLMTIHAYFDFKDPVSKFIFFFGIIYFPFSLINLYRQSSNRLFLLPRVLKFTNEKVISQTGGSVVLDTPATSEIPTDWIAKTVTLKRYWVLFVGKANFIVVPKNVFLMESDAEQFKKIFLKN